MSLGIWRQGVWGQGAVVLLSAAASCYFTKELSLGGGFKDEGKVALIILALQVYWAASEVSVL